MLGEQLCCLLFVFDSLLCVFVWGKLLVSERALCILVLLFFFGGGRKQVWVNRNDMCLGSETFLPDYHRDCMIEELVCGQMLFSEVTLVSI